jgi:hypothetical protein
VIHFSFLKIPPWLWLCYRTARLWPQTVWTPKLLFNGHSWSVELWWKVNRHISFHCYYIAWSCLCVLNSESKPVSTVYFLTLQKNCLAPTPMKLYCHFTN